MTFNEVINQTIAMLHEHGRVSYRALKRQFAIQDDYSIQEKDCLINALKQPEPIRSAGCRVRGFLPVHW